MPTVAIIGTREPSDQQRRKAYFLAFHLSREYNCLITTGGAYGIDEAAINGALVEKLNLYLPWTSYNRDIVPDGATVVVAHRGRNKDWFNSVYKYHPAPDKLTFGAKALHARNFGIIANADLVIAFPNEDGSGGTGQGIRIAQALNVPVMQFYKGRAIPQFNEVLAAGLEHLGLSPIAETIQPELCEA